MNHHNSWMEQTPSLSVSQWIFSNIIPAYIPQIGPLTHVTILRIYSDTFSLPCNSQVRRVVWGWKGGGVVFRRGYGERQVLKGGGERQRVGKTRCPPFLFPYFPLIFHVSEQREGGQKRRSVAEVEERSSAEWLKCDDLHVSWASGAGLSLALGKSVSRLDMRSSSACTSLRPNFEPASHSSEDTGGQVCRGKGSAFLLNL